VLRGADHVLMVCGNVLTHHEVRIIRFNCVDIDNVIANKGFHRFIFYRVAMFQLTQYSRVLALDLDMYISGNIAGAFTYPTPGMVRWESAAAGPFQPNGGCVLVRPERALYQAAMWHLQRLPIANAPSRLKRLSNMMTPWGAFGNSSVALPPKPWLVSAGDSDQQFMLMFWNVLERERFGPIRELPYEYNVRHAMLNPTKNQWTSKAFLTFMSRPEQGFIRSACLCLHHPASASRSC